MVPVVGSSLGVFIPRTSPEIPAVKFPESDLLLVGRPNTFLYDPRTLQFNIALQAWQAVNQGLLSGVSLPALRT